MLRIDQLKDFELFCFSKGWRTVLPGGEWEILRMVPQDGGTPLIVHKRLRHNQITFHGESLRLAMEYYEEVEMGEQ